MPSTFTLAYDEWLQCDACQRRGVQFWADNHARETGHHVFTVVTDHERTAA